VLQVVIKAPTYETTKFGKVPVVDAVATYDEANGTVAVFAVNRSTSEPVCLTVDLRSLPGLRVIGATTLANPDHTWAASADDSTSVLPQDNTSVVIDAGRLTIEIPPVSWNTVTLGA
jgi:alpha-N-arabinofuranosidase